jgi:hypothetical protein
MSHINLQLKLAEQGRLAFYDKDSKFRIGLLISFDPKTGLCVFDCYGEIYKSYRIV